MGLYLSHFQYLQIADAHKPPFRRTKWSHCLPLQRWLEFWVRELHLIRPQQSLDLKVNIQGIKLKSKLLFNKNVTFLVVFSLLHRIILMYRPLKHFIFYKKKNIQFETIAVDKYTFNAIVVLK